MNDLKVDLENYNFKINSLKYEGNVVIIDTNDGKYVYKDKKNNYEIYDYLLSRGFSFYPKTINSKNSKYELTEYINENKVSREQKVNDLIHITGFLHKKTSFNKEIDMDDLKIKYENYQNDANYLMNYYQNLNNYIDSSTFMSPLEYLLVRNIDLFYYLISFVKVESSNWYKLLENKKSISYCMIHDNLDLSHLIEGNNLYLISWDRAHLDTPIKDLKKIYQDNYDVIDLENFISEYEKENNLSYVDKLFLLLELSIPKRIEFGKNMYLDCYNLSKYITYLRKIASLIQKIEKKNEKI